MRETREAARHPAPDTPKLLKEMNDRIRDVRARTMPEDEDAEFLCECSDEACSGTVKLSPREYDALRENANSFVIAPGHRPSWTAHVVGRSDSYLIVE